MAKIPIVSVYDQDGNRIEVPAIVGRSAYQSAQKLGYTGSEEEWIESLRGKDGRGIKSIVRTEGDGTPGTTDTYTITYTDNESYTFTVHNGIDRVFVEEQLTNLSKEILNLNTTRINVRDFGAVGDGVTDDRQAIVDAFAAALDNLPCEVYFPAGTYGISNGITVNMEYGTGGLLVRGAGRDVTTIKYLEDGYNPDVSGNSTLWYALRVWPVGMPNIKPTNETDYLHDISITDITVYDPDPIDHAWNTCKGDPSGEETHGFDLQYVNRAAVTNCNIITVGDEAIDLCGCIDSIVSGNHIVGSPAAGSAGGAISIGDGCRGVVVSGNTVDSSCGDEVLETQVIVAKGKTLSTKAILPDGTTYTKSTVMTADTVFPAGTVLDKGNYGIAIESLSITVSDIVVVGNTIANIHGNGVNFGATQTGAGLKNITIANNIIRGCSTGIAFSGTQPKSGLKISANTITDCYSDNASHGYGINGDNGYTDLTISDNTFLNIGGSYALRLPAAISKQVISNNYFGNLAQQAIFCTGDVMVSGCVFNGVGTGGHLGSLGAIQKYHSTGANSKLTISGCKMVDVRSNCAIQGATVVESTEIEMVNASGTPNAGGDVFKNISGDANSLFRVINCKLGARFIINRDNAIVQGVQIESTNIGTNAIIVNANGVLVTGCNIRIDKYSAIKEGSGYNGNIFTNNVTNRSIDTVGANSIAANNVDLRNLTTA